MPRSGRRSKRTQKTKLHEDETESREIPKLEVGQIKTNQSDTFNLDGLNESLLDGSNSSTSDDVWSQHKQFCLKNKNDGKASSSTSGGSVTGEVENDDKREKSYPFFRGIMNPFSECGPCFHCGAIKRNRKTCTGCKIAKYCNKDCQAAHWPEHKSDCSFFTKKDSTPSADQAVGKGQKPATAGPRIVHCSNCWFCKKAVRDVEMKKCSECEVAKYCDHRCEARHRFEHKTACENYPGFDFVSARMSEVFARHHGIEGTDFTFPPLDLFDTAQHRSKRALLLEIVAVDDEFRHSFYVQDVNGVKAHMVFDHNPIEEITWEHGRWSQNIVVGNFIRWVKPRWSILNDGTVGFRVDSLYEAEYLEKSINHQRLFDYLLANILKD